MHSATSWLELAAFMLLAGLLPGREDEAPRNEESPARAPPYQRVLAGDEAKRVKELEKSIEDLYGPGTFGQALPLAREVAEARRRVQGPDHWQTLDAEWGVKQLERLSALSPEEQSGWPALLQLGKDAFELEGKGQYSRARAHWEEVRAASAKMLGEEDLDTLFAHEKIAENLRAQGEYAEAQLIFEKTLVLRIRLQSEDHPKTAGTYGSLGMNLRGQGKYAEAQPLLEKALAICLRVLGEERAETALAYLNLAANLQSLRKYEEVQGWIEKALVVRRNLYGEEHASTLMAYTRLAKNSGLLGRFAEAQSQYERILELQKKRPGDRHPNTNWTRNSLALMLAKQGKYAASQPLYEEALSNLEAELGKENSGLFTLNDNLGFALWAQGKFAEAAAVWEKGALVLESSRKTLGLAGFDRGFFMEKSGSAASLAAVLARLERPEESWRRLEERLARGLLDELYARDARTLTEADRRREEKLLADLNRVEALLRAPDRASRERGQSDLAQRQLELTAELSAFRQHLTDTYGAAEGTSYDLARIQARIPDGAALVAWLDMEGEPHAADPGGEHWAIVLRSKGKPACVKLPGSGPGGAWDNPSDTTMGSRLTDLLREGHAAGSAAQTLVDALARQRIRPVEELLAGQEGMPPARRLIVLPSAAMSGVPVALLTDRLSVSYIPSGTILAWLRERKSNPEAAARGRRLLAFGDPLFSPESGATRLKPVEPPGEGICIALVERFSNAERGGIHAGDVVLEYGGEKLAEQGDLLQAIGKKRETDKVPVSIWREGETLALLVDPGRLGVQLDPRPARETLFADRDFEGLLRGVRHASEILFPLPGTRREVEAIAEKCARRGVEVKQLLGSDAAEERISELVASGDLSTYRYLHFATHAVPSLERAFESSLFFSQSTAGGPREAAPGDRAVADGRLTAAEILRTWKLDADLVVLSACQTAVGVHTQEEGFLGFAQALLLAGARSVVLTLWKVDDAATTFLMTRFYENLLGARQGLTQPMQKVEALREAQGWLRGLTRAEVEALSGRLPALERGPERPIKRAAPPPGGEHPYASPRFWAAFILIGDPE